MIKDIKISKLDNKKVKEAKTFMLNIIKDDFGYDFNPEWHWDIEKLEDIYLKPETSIFYIAELGDEIIGTIAARAYDKNYPEFQDKYTKENTLSIWRHYIKKELRGNKTGTNLFKKAEEFAKDKGFKYLYLHTQKNIPGSLEYWLAKGFAITSDVNDELQTVHLEKIILTDLAL